MKRWTEEEVEFLKNNYPNKLHRNLSSEIKRKKGSIDYMAQKLGLKKNYDFYCESRKKYDKEIKKELLEELYFKRNKSMREIAKMLALGKTTIEYYFKKFSIDRRERSEANKIRATKYTVWKKGLTKETDIRLAKLGEKIKKTYAIKRERRLQNIESKYGKPMAEIISDLYWKEKLTQDKIAKKLGLDRLVIIKIMKKFNIEKRPNFEYISNLSGEKHPMYGKKWEQIYGIEKTKEIKKQYGERMRIHIIRRMREHKMPFRNTRIEKKMGELLSILDIPFISQYPINNKFVCDFALPELKIIIECDGDYWHANPQKYKNNLNQRQQKQVQTDKYKDLYIQNQGWKVLRFFETDILSNPSSCLEKIKEAVSPDALKKIKNPLDSL